MPAMQQVPVQGQVQGIPQPPTVWQKREWIAGKERRGESYEGARMKTDLVVPLRKRRKPSFADTERCSYPRTQRIVALPPFAQSRWEH